MHRMFSSMLVRSMISSILIFLLISLLARVALLSQSISSVDWNMSLVGAFFCGTLSDLAASVFACLPWIMLIMVTPARLWRSRAGTWVYSICLLIFIMALVFTSVSEWVFWDEFGVRFNFIAVDYLVFTTEVVENIAQSYPIGLILLGVGVLSGGLVFLLRRMGVVRWVLSADHRWLPKASAGLTAVAIMVTLALAYSQSYLPRFSNTYNGELAKNGCWSFFAAYHNMEIDYDQWYRTMPIEEAKSRIAGNISSSQAIFPSGREAPFARLIPGKQPEHRWNVIVVFMESMSAEFMGYAGNQKQLSPRLDELAKNSIFFSNLMATGTRTVRGMEALTLNLPPTPGQAIFYRPQGMNLKTTFTPFLERGYDCAFLYGGHGQFDYMNRYFSTSGCRIVDLGEWKKEEVTMKTAWGACDEDLFHKTISEADRAFAEGRGFHYFCMTTSNHRPYDFPDGRIERKTRSPREAAVQYADWAVGDLIDRASTKPWFHDTLFVICADHCASSAGKAELDVTKYHIPAMIYNPRHVPAKKIDRLCSQIDVMPTVFSLLGWKHQTVGFGEDQLDPEVMRKSGRAYISNYQKIAMLRENRLAILKPGREYSLYECDPTEGKLKPLALDDSDALLNDAIASYQTASWLFKNGKLKRDGENH